MKQKKGILTFLILMMALMAGCQRENWKVYEIAGETMDTECFEYSGDVYGLPQVADYSRSAAEKNKTFTFQGEEYLLSYNETCSRDLLSYHEDMYRMEDTGTTFYFRTDTGKLSGIFTNGTALEITEQKPEGKEEYLQLATDVLKEYIPVGEYEVICETELTIFEKQGSIGQRSYRTEPDFYVPVDETETANYVIAYRRYVGGYPSSDMAVIVLDEAGKLQRLNIGEINAFRGKTAFQVEEKYMEEQVGKKLKSLCKTGYEIESFSHSSILCIDDEGKPYFMVSVFPEIKKTETKEIRNEMCVFIFAPE